MWYEFYLCRVSLNGLGLKWRIRWRYDTAMSAQKMEESIAKTALISPRFPRNTKQCQMMKQCNQKEQAGAQYLHYPVQWWCLLNLWCHRFPMRKWQQWVHKRTPSQSLRILLCILEVGEYLRGQVTWTISLSDERTVNISYSFVR